LPKHLAASGIWRGKTPLLNEKFAKNIWRDLASGKICCFKSEVYQRTFSHFSAPPNGLAENQMQARGIWRR
jgi:hypothetical protein